MARQQRTEKPEAPPVDPEDSDRRALAPEASSAQDEHRGLAARLLDLRKTVEEHRLVAVREHAQQNQRVAQLEQQVTAMASRIDQAIEAIQGMQRDLQTALREGGEQVRVAGELARKMTDKVKELEELREMASDPHEVIKPLQRGLATLRGDMESLARTIDVRFEQQPKAKSQPYESRDASEDPIVKMGKIVRELKERVAALES